MGIGKNRLGAGKGRGLGCNLHFEVSDAAAMVEKARRAGYRIVQEPRKYDFGTEAFIADPAGYNLGVCVTAVRDGSALQGPEVEFPT